MITKPSVVRWICANWLTIQYKLPLRVNRLLVQNIFSRIWFGCHTTCLFWTARFRRLLCRTWSYTTLPGVCLTKGTSKCWRQLRQTTDETSKSMLCKSVWQSKPSTTTFIPYASANALPLSELSSCMVRDSLHLYAPGCLHVIPEVAPSFWRKTKCYCGQRYRLLLRLHWSQCFLPVNPHATLWLTWWRNWLIGPSRMRWKFHIWRLKINNH